VVAALLGVAAAGAMWWASFTSPRSSPNALHHKAMDPAGRARMARDSYTYLHMPMVAGIVISRSVGVKETLRALERTLHSSRPSPCAAESPCT